jgi:outer membrane cobalamin receptor
MMGNAFKNIYVSDATHKKFEFNPNTSNPNNSLTGILKYRFRHTFKFDVQGGYKGFSLGSLLTYYSYLDNVDEAFITFIPGIEEDRIERNYTGDLVWNLRAAYNVKEKVNFSVIVSNVLNNEYALRPAKQNAPRSFTFQTRFLF